MSFIAASHIFPPLHGLPRCPSSAIARIDVPAHDERPARARALLAGLALPILGGVSSLLLPIDDILPMEIRRVHILEIFGSNFLFAVITAWMLVRRTSVAVPLLVPARS